MDLLLGSDSLLLDDNLNLPSVPKMQRQLSGLADTQYCLIDEMEKLNDSNRVINVLMIGTGEYTTGYVGKKNASKSDKAAGGMHFL